MSPVPVPVPVPTECWSRLVRSCLLWKDSSLSGPTRLHDSTCSVEDGECTCRSAEDQLSVGSLVVKLRSEGLASLVSIAGHLPVWIESDAVEETQISIGEPSSSSVIPSDYLEWMASMDRDILSKKRVRAPPKGGGLVFVRADKSREPWRWLGHVHHEGKRAALLVDPTIPLDQMLDVRPEQVRVVPLEGREVRNVLVPALPVEQAQAQAQAQGASRTSRRRHRR